MLFHLLTRQDTDDPNIGIIGYGIRLNDLTVAGVVASLIDLAQVGWVEQFFLRITDVAMNQRTP